jgi:hypothetical protein
MTEWSKTPPSEPGLYWRRGSVKNGCLPQFAKPAAWLLEHGVWWCAGKSEPVSSLQFAATAPNGEWWPEPIPPPVEIPSFTVTGKPLSDAPPEIVEEARRRVTDPRCLHLTSRDGKRITVYVRDPSRGVWDVAFANDGGKAGELLGMVLDADPAIQMAHACACAVCMHCSAGTFPLLAPRGDDGYRHDTKSLSPGANASVACKASAIHRLIGTKVAL